MWMPIAMGLELTVEEDAQFILLEMPLLANVEVGEGLLHVVDLQLRDEGAVVDVRLLTLALCVFGASQDRGLTASTSSSHVFI